MHPRETATVHNHSSYCENLKLREPRHKARGRHAGMHTVPPNEPNELLSTILGVGRLVIIFTTTILDEECPGTVSAEKLTCVATWRRSVRAPVSTRRDLRQGKMDAASEAVGLLGAANEPTGQTLIGCFLNGPLGTTRRDVPAEWNFQGDPDSFIPVDVADG